MVSSIHNMDTKGKDQNVRITEVSLLLQATRGARNPNLQVAITHAQHLHYHVKLTQNTVLEQERFDL